MALVAAAAEQDDRRMTYEPHTCPFCELRFDYHNEVKDHILHDHRDHPGMAATVEIHEMPHV